MAFAVIHTVLLATAVHAARYDEYILAPSSRSLRPASVYNVNGSVTNPAGLTGESSGVTTFQGESAVTYDFGKNVGGLASLHISNADESDQYLGITFTESSLWISGNGSDGTADAGLDVPLWFHITGPGNYTVDRIHERGAFRYLSVVHNTTGAVELDGLTVHFTAMPHWEDDQLREYSGWFHCDDDLINRIWYAGAYTNQLTTIDPHYGDTLIHLGEINSTQPGDTGPNTWWSNTTITNGTSTLVDGAKRDRLVWAGDMAIAMPVIAVTTYDLVSVENALDSLFNLQNKSSGQMPYAGVGFFLTYSATYHLYTLIGIADHYLYSGDMDYLRGKWEDWKLGLEFSLAFIDDSGMMNVTSSSDWLRFGMGGHNIEANSIFYYTINQGIVLGNALGEDSSLLDSWAEKSAAVKTAANSLLWDDDAGLYRDNETTTLHPQDGNSWAVVSGLVDSTEKMTRISSGLAARWGPYGAPAVEASNAVSPFISAFELQMHLLAGNASAALDLIKLQWGFMLDDPRMTNSTFIEGYSSDGALHYAPYTNDPRVSHAHGWATGPTSVLTSHFAGIQVSTAAGQTWEISPVMGSLKNVDAGFSTSLGDFSSLVSAADDGSIAALKFTTPSSTTGTVKLPGVSGSLISTNGTSVALVDGAASNVSGGTWILQKASSPVQGEGAALRTSWFIGLVGFMAALIC
ncbi:Six-hairpin glycosidase [Xylariaceae sp. FL0804]|nr:Six-hairpin glycosidase [Xylariaceae sp. FL0804]